MTESNEKAAIKLMIVDDEIIVAEDLKGRVIDLGYEVTAVVGTGAEAVAKAGETMPDLILMDIQLKGAMDGIDAAGEIKKRFNISVIYLTAYSDQVTLDRAKITTPFGYLIKPFAERELHSMIEMALYKEKMDKEVRTLKGMLPICADCKSIRDDEGYWSQLEDYMTKHSEAEFTHGLCPVCAKKLLNHAKRK